MSTVNARRVAALLVPVAGALALALSPVPDRTLEAYSESARIVARQMPRLHVTHLRCDDRVATNALENFLSALDFDHSYFLASDVAAFRDLAAELDDLLARGDLGFATRVYDVLVARVSNRVEYVNRLLDTGFDLTRQETFAWKRKEAPWPADEEAWDDIWRRKVKSQYVARVVADRLAAEEAERAEETAKADEPPGGGDTSPAVKLTPEEDIRKQFRQYLEVLRDNDANWLLSLYMTSFARAYDPHSDFMSAENAEDFDITMKLSLTGIGALLSVEDGAAKVVRLIPGGPAERDGRLQPGDKIIAVGQGDQEPVDILHWPLGKSVRLIRGEKGTRVVLVVIPASDISGSITKRIDLVRDEVKLEEGAAKGELKRVGAEGAERSLGVIRIPDFYADVKGQRNGEEQARSVTRDVRRILSDLQTNAIQGLVLDLRNNGGGLLNEAVELTGLFINLGPVVQVKSESGVNVLSDPDPERVYRGPLVVLVNRMSASASEILAGALQDYGRAVIVGDSKTHGKGTVQSIISLHRSRAELGALKLTTATFYRIAGGSTQMRGVTPDIVIPSILEFTEIGEEFQDNPLPWSAIDRALYRSSTNLAALLPGLRAQSEARREKDPRFLAYAGLLDHLGERRRSEEISLNLEDRLTMARREKEMEKLIRDSGQGEEEKSGEGADLILDEALNILADLVAVQEAPEAESVAAQ